MRVLHINSYYHGSPFYKRLFEAQLALGEDIRVFVPLPLGAKLSFDPGPFTDESPDFGRYDFLCFQYKHNKILGDAMARYATDARQFDVLHAHTLFSNGSVARELSLKLGIPYIVAVRNSDIHAFFRWMPHLRSLGRRILRDAKKVIFLSATYRDEALKPYLSESELAAVKQKSVLIPNGIDDFWHKNAASAPRALVPGEIRLVTVGRANKDKNVPTALKAAELLSRAGHKVTFDVVLGSADDRQILNRIEACPLVRLHQNLTHEQMLPVLRGADLFVLPSLHETFGLVYAEAMTQALPVLYTRGQGFDGQFPEGEVGYRINPTDEKQIASRILDVLNHHPAMAQRALFESARYDWAKYAAQYEAIYREVKSACASNGC